jgi:lipopolysaccharide/colanic/teichoic acid biosynthesis glycosyltransferase
MRLHAPGQKFTARGDTRITPVGRLIRKLKIDELPQLLNVLLGDMSFVGPRPEVPEYVDLGDPLWQRVLAVKPGLTHPLTLLLHPEEELLAKVQGDSKQFYDRYFLPYKLRGYIDYLQERTAWTDLWTMLRTLREIAAPRRGEQPTLEEIEAAADEANTP